MKKGFKLFSISVFPVFLLLPLCSISCAGPASISTHIKDHYVYSSFKDVGPDISLSEFRKVFSPGDIITMEVISRSGNKYSVDMPYVNSYVEAGDYAPCICDDVDEVTNLPDIDLSLAMWPYGHGVETKEFFGCPVTFSMKNKGGYNKILELTRCTTKLTLDELSGDTEAFANFRGITYTGELKKFIRPNVAFRGSAPFLQPDSDTRHNYVDKLIGACDIEYNICLSTSPNGFKRKMDNLRDRGEGKNILKLYDEGNYQCFNIGSDYFTPDTVDPITGEISTGGASKVRDVLVAIGNCVADPDNIKPFYIHCDEGKDRTGFICVLLEAFAFPLSNQPNREYEFVDENDIVGDFMTSLKNYFNINPTDGNDRYQTFLDLTVYRHLLAICLEDPATELGNIDWYNPDFNTRALFREKLGDKTLFDHAVRFVRSVLHLEKVPQAINKLSNLYLGAHPITLEDK